MKRYEKIVLEAEKGIGFEVSEGIRGELLIRALNIDTANGYSPNYVNPPIPEGYKHICGEWNNGYVIERGSDGSQFVWIPVGSLDSNGTLDGEHFDSKFGRCNFRNEEFADYGYHEELKGELHKQLKSVKKYGGFYISRYNIAMSSEGKPQSVKGTMPRVNDTYYDAKFYASMFEDSKAVESHLPFGAEYDSVLRWLIKTRTKTFAEIAENSAEWGNYQDTENSPKQIVKTGSREDWSVNNIYDLAGNVAEWTQERYKDENYYWVIRGGSYGNSGRDLYTVAGRHIIRYDYLVKRAGFRVALYIK